MRFQDSARFYSQMRRQRQWANRGNQGLQGYAEFLSGYGEDTFSPVLGAETAAMDDEAGVPVWQSIAIGVTTAALSFLVNRWLSKVLK